MLAVSDPTVDWTERVRRATPGSRWPFEANAFDIVFSHHVLEHVQDLDSFMVEQHRVLRPGGRAIHVFPSSRLMIEPHLDVPFVHWARTDRGRKSILRVARTLGIGSSPWKARGIDAQVDYLSGSTFFRTHDCIARTARAAGLYVTVGPTMQYGVELIRALTARTDERSSSRVPSERQKLFSDSVSTSIGQWVLPVALLMEVPLASPR